MAELQELAAIYQTYEEKLLRASASAGLFSGAFGMGDDPRRHPCNEVFYEAVEEWIGQYVSESPDSDQAEQIVSYILSYPASVRGKPTYWYSFAAMQLASPLIPFLTTDSALRLQEEFHRLYKTQDILPAQEALLKKLCKQAGSTSSSQPAVTAFLQTWGKRLIMLMLGLTIAHLGVTLFILADLGADPFNILIQGLRHTVARDFLTQGTVHACVSFVIVVALLLVDRSYVRIGTFLCMLLGGPIIDIFTLLLCGVINNTSPLWARVGAVALGCFILAFGMTIVIQSNAGTGPNDLVAVVISDKLHKKFGIVRVITDCSFAAAGFLLLRSFALMDIIGPFICMVVVGPVAQIFMPFSKKLCQRVTGDQST